MPWCILFFFRIERRQPAQVVTYSLLTEQSQPTYLEMSDSIASAWELGMVG
jgi:hypothetical protein